MGELVVTRVDRATVRLGWRLLEREYHQGLRLSVERSESYSGPYLPLVSGVQDTIVYEDHTDARVYYYRLVATRQDQTTVTIPSQGGRSCQDLGPEVTPTMRETGRILLRDLVRQGRSVLYYPVKQWGERCGNCYDRRTGKRDESCPSCFGVGFSGGFFNPLVIPAAVGAGVVRERGVRVVESATRAIIPYTPLASKGDVLIEREDRWWLVDVVSLEETRRYAVRQVLTILPLAPDAGVRQLPVDYSLLGVAPTATIRRVA